MKILSQNEYDISCDTKFDINTLSQYPILSDSKWKKIEWNKDFCSGHIWDINTFYTDIKVAPQKGAEIKIPLAFSAAGK